MIEALRIAGLSIGMMVGIALIVIEVSMLMAWIVGKIGRGRGEIIEEVPPITTGAPFSLHEERKRRAMIAAAIAAFYPPERRL